MFPVAVVAWSRRDICRNAKTGDSLFLPLPDFFNKALASNVMASLLLLTPELLLHDNLREKGERKERLIKGVILLFLMVF